MFCKAFPGQTKCGGIRTRRRGRRSFHGPSLRLDQSTPECLPPSSYSMRIIIWLFFFRCASISCISCIVADWRTETGDWPFLMLNSSATICLVLHTWEWYVWSPRPDQTKLYLSYVDKYICVLCIFLKMKHVHICLKWQNVFVPNFKMYLS